jgi:hypothetical protein
MMEGHYILKGCHLEMMTLPHHNMRDDNALHSDDCVKKENANK